MFFSQVLEIVLNLSCHNHLVTNSSAYNEWVIGIHSANQLPFIAVRVKSGRLNDVEIEEPSEGIKF